MRKTTIKKFRRYDLVLRNEDEVCVLDWKFSNNDPENLLRDRKFTIKNKDYYELARMEFKAEVKLKYIVMTPELVEHHQKYLVAEYEYPKNTIEIEAEDDSDCDLDEIQPPDCKKIIPLESISNTNSHIPPENPFTTAANVLPTQQSF